MQGPEAHERAALPTGPAEAGGSTVRSAALVAAAVAGAQTLLMAEALALEAGEGTWVSRLEAFAVRRKVGVAGESLGDGEAGACVVRGEERLVLRVPVVAGVQPIQMWLHSTCAAVLR